MKNRKSPNIATSATASNASSKFCKALAAARRIGLHPKTIHRWAAAGLIKSYKITDRVVLFDEAEIQQLIQSSCTSSVTGGQKS